MLRAHMPWRMVVLGAAVGIAFLGGAGCGDQEAEDCFELTVDLAQVTSDTLITDHLDASLSPDGTRVVFTTDYWGIKALEDKDERDFAIVELPNPGDPPRTPVERLTDVGNARRVILPATLVDLLGRSFNPVLLGSNIGAATWIDDQRIIAVVEEPQSNLPRLYVFDLDPAPMTAGRIDVLSFQLIDDGFLDLADPNVTNNNQVYYVHPAVSPDGQWVAYSRFFFKPAIGTEGSPTYQPPVSIQPAIVAYNLVTGETVRVTNGSTVEDDPAWSPDGQWIAFTSNGGEFGSNEVYKVRFDPANPATERAPGGPFTDGRIRLTFTNTEPEVKIPVGSFDPTWLADGRIVFVSTRRAPCTSVRERNLWVMGADGGEPKLFYRSDEDDAFPTSTNLQSASPNALRTVVFSSRHNPVEDFKGQKSDLYVLRF